MEKKTPLQAKITDEKISAITRYRQTVVGDKGILFWLFFEFVTLIASATPSLLGVVLRTVLYKFIFKSVGRGVYFGRNITIRHPHKISIGANTIIDDGCVLDAKGGDEGYIEIGSNVTMARNTVLGCKGGHITIGANANIGISSVIHSEKSVEIGKDVLISSFCYIIGGGKHEFERTDVPIIAQGIIPPVGVKLEDNVWLGANVMVNDGVTIQSGSVVGTSSLVNKSLDKNSVSYGVPVKTARIRP